MHYVKKYWVCGFLRDYHNALKERRPVIRFGYFDTPTEAYNYGNKIRKEGFGMLEYRTTMVLSKGVKI